MKVIVEGDLKELLLTGKNRRYKNVANNRELFNGLIRAVNLMIAANDVGELKTASFLHYERLRFNLSGLSSVRLSNRYVHRLIFKEFNDHITLKLIEINDTHYGNKK